MPSKWLHYYSFWKIINSAPAKVYFFLSTTREPIYYLGDATAAYTIRNDVVTGKPLSEK